MSSTLQLAYAFRPSPNPIQASPKTGNAVTVDLEVIISNTGLSLPTLTKIQIELPDLSAASELPSPTLGQGQDKWDVSVEGESVTIQPKTGASQQFDQSILFTLPGIQVNASAGIVKVTITEYTATGHQEDGDTYSLTKWAADFPVTNFRTDPAELTDIDQPVTLYWTGSSEVVYSLRSSDGWQPKKCSDPDDCYTAEDGKNGVSSPNLHQTTTFYLDIIRQAEGKPTLLNTLDIVVDLFVPHISELSSVQIVVWDTLLQVKALAENAAYVQVEWGGTVLEPKLAPDTYHEGARIMVPYSSGSYPVTLFAYPLRGDGPPASHSVGTVTQSKIQSVTVNHPVSVAITPDGKTALVCSYSDGNTGTVSVVDVNDPHNVRVIGSISFDFLVQPVSVAITPNGKTALVVDYHGDTVSVLDMSDPHHVTIIATIPVGQSPYSVAITPDGKTALVCNSGTSTVSVLDVSDPHNVTVIGTIPVGQSPYSVAITPDGKTALVCNQAGNTVSVLTDKPTAQ